MAHPELFKRIESMGNPSFGFFFPQKIPSQNSVCKNMFYSQLFRPLMSIRKQLADPCKDSTLIIKSILLKKNKFMARK